MTPDWMRSLRRLVWYMAVSYLSCSTAYAQDEIGQRLDRLEKQMQQVLQALKSHGLLDSTTTPQSPVVNPAPASVVQHGGYANIRYYLSESVLGDSPPSQPPAASGRIALDEQIDLQPKTYQAGKDGVFSIYRDPSRYRAAGLWLEAQLPIPQRGIYRFSLLTRPAREGGTAVTTTETIKFWLNERLVFDVNATPKWHTWTQSLDLAPGQYKLKLWFQSSSPGFGPTPVDSSLRLRLQRPGDATAIPLGPLLTVVDNP
jgi:hypothetical protein